MMNAFSMVPAVFHYYALTLPVSCFRGPATRFRMRQSNWGPTDTWAIARLYIGQPCPAMCTGHGECREGICL